MQALLCDPYVIHQNVIWSPSHTPDCCDLSSSDTGSWPAGLLVLLLNRPFSISATCKKVGLHIRAYFLLFYRGGRSSSETVVRSSQIVFYKIVHWYIKESCFYHISHNFNKKLTIIIAVLHENCAVPQWHFIILLITCIVEIWESKQCLKYEFLNILYKYEVFFFFFCMLEIHHIF